MVKSVIVFEGSKTDMKRLGKVYVSGNHKVLHGGRWIRVEDHPDAVGASSFSRIYCLNVEGDHTIQSEGYTFKDYEETDNPMILRKFFQQVEAYYGTLTCPPKLEDPLKYRYTGVRPSTFIMMSSRIGDVAKLASEVRIGDVLNNDCRVQAIIHHNNVRMSSFENGTFALGTWIKRDSRGITPLIDDYTDDREDVIQFIVEGSQYNVLTPCGGRFTVLDDHEVPDEDIHDWRDEQIQKEHET
jgi:hypothetical protein